MMNKILPRDFKVIRFMVLLYTQNNEALFHETMLAGRNQVPARCSPEQVQQFAQLAQTLNDTRLRATNELLDALAELPEDATESQVEALVEARGNPLKAAARQEPTFVAVAEEPHESLRQRLLDHLQWMRYCAYATFCAVGNCLEQLPSTLHSAVKTQLQLAAEKVHNADRCIDILAASDDPDVLEDLLASVSGRPAAAALH